MIPREPGDTTKEAFRLFEDGRFPESLAACNRMLEEEKDPALEVLAATNLFHAGRYEDAEVFFRDLAVRMPGSSYVHSYLGKVLEARGNDEATSEYAAAVRLDPANQDALRSYAGYLLSRNDFRGPCHYCSISRNWPGQKKTPATWCGRSSAADGGGGSSCTPQGAGGKPEVFTGICRSAPPGTGLLQCSRSRGFCMAVNTRPRYAPDLSRCTCPV
ncbi:MAG TPA: hypothetical protein VHN82_07140 [Methanoregula sp.]|nr:hypothetical protein [Methanoregula sp.]